jgi:hypothetical protein
LVYSRERARVDGLNRHLIGVVNQESKIKLGPYIFYGVEVYVTPKLLAYLFANSQPKTDALPVNAIVLLDFPEHFEYFWFVLLFYTVPIVLNLYFYKFFAVLFINLTLKPNRASFF